MSLGIKRMRPLRAITASFEGAPGDIPNRLDAMYEWARARGLRTGERDPVGRMNLPWMAILHDENDTEADAARTIDLWMPIDGAGPSDMEYTVKDIAHTNVAFMIHKGPLNKYEESIRQLFEWATQKELTFRGRVHRRVFTRGVDAHPEDPDWEAEIQIPLLQTRSN